MQNLINILNQSFALEKKSAGEFEKIKVSGMNFTIERYWAKGLGNVSVMRAAGFFGLMKMDTFIINPTECDMPLFSYDRVFASRLGSEAGKLILEGEYGFMVGYKNLRDTLLEFCEIAGMPNEAGELKYLMKYEEFYGIMS